MPWSCRLAWACEARPEVVALKSFRLIETGDAEALADHLARDAAAFARWDPEHPLDYYTTDGQRSRIAAVRARHAHGEVWPAVVLAGDVVIGRVTAQNLLLHAWRKAELGYWIASTTKIESAATGTTWETTFKATALEIEK